VDFKKTDTLHGKFLTDKKAVKLLVEKVTFLTTPEVEIKERLKFLEGLIITMASKTRVKITDDETAFMARELIVAVLDIPHNIRGFVDFVKSRTNGIDDALMVVDIFIEEGA